MHRAIDANVVIYCHVIEGGVGGDKVARDGEDAAHVEAAVDGERALVGFLHVEIGAGNVVGEDAVILWEVLCAAIAFPSGRGHAIAGFGFVIIGGDKGGGGI